MSLRKGNYKKLGYALCVFVMYWHINCGIRSKNDIYEKIPIGSRLSKTILKKAAQIIPNNSELVLVYNISTVWDNFSPHLLFYDSTLKLYASSFFSSDKIDSIKNNVINAVLSENGEKKKSLFRNDLPKKYQLNFYGGESVTGSYNRANKIVERIQFDSIRKNIILYIRKSDNFFIGVGYKRSPLTDSAFFKDFSIPDTLTYAMTDIIFDFDRSVVKRKFIESSKFIWEEMIVIDKSSLLELYDEIFRFYGYAVE